MRRADALVSGWWTPAAIGLAVVPGCALLTATFAEDLRWVRVFARLAAVGFIVAISLWLVAWNGGELEELRGNWLVIFSGLVGLSAALAMRAIWALVVQVSATTLSALTNQLGLVSDQSLIPRVAYEALWASTYSCVFVLAVVTALRTARLLDVTGAVVRRDARVSAARAARDAERARFDALIHDHVLATLLEAHREPHDDGTRRHARAALAELDDLTGRPDAIGQVGAAAIVTRLEGVLGSIDDTTNFEVIIDDDDRTDHLYPVDVVAEIIAAAAEALRNSVRHAGGDVHRRGEVTFERDHIRVVVADSGSGFDVDALGTGRLGINLSITSRMSRIAGGRSSVRSQPGAGTVVELEWRR
ncbi:ATP-binding protein [Gordonia soli]|nr:ATP-binding protein [Gordonia soli]